jgi:FkbM family methyltransferase
MKIIFISFYNFFENFFHLIRIKRFIKKNIHLTNPTIFDIGAHKGKLSKMFNEVYEECSIYCFEPNIYLHKHIRRISENIKIYDYAVGDKLEEKEFFLNNIDLTSSLSKLNKKSFYLKIKKLFIDAPLINSKKKIKVVTLDKFCKSKNIKEIDFLKIDVEGYELMVLKGAKEIINNVKYVMIEIQKNDMYQEYSREKIKDFLLKNNFRLIKKFNFPFMFFQDCLYKKL